MAPRGSMLAVIVPIVPTARVSRCTDRIAASSKMKAVFYRTQLGELDQVQRVHLAQEAHHSALALVGVDIAVLGE